MDWEHGNARKRITLLQKACLLGTAKILQRHLTLWEVALYSGVTRKPLRTIYGVKH